MTRLIVSCLWLVCLVSFSSIALAPSTAVAEVSEADQEACTPDVFRLCQDFIPNEGPIVTCLEAKRSQLSPACLHVMFPPAQSEPVAKATKVRAPLIATKTATKLPKPSAHRPKRRHKTPKPT